VFSGIVEEKGTVAAKRGARLVVEAGVTREGMEMGSSLAVNGVCLTAVELGTSTVAFDLGPETLARSTLGDLDAGDPRTSSARFASTASWAGTSCSATSMASGS